MLHTARLTLRPFSSDDADDLLAIISAKGVLDYFPPGPPPSIEMAVRMIERVNADWETVGYGLWAVEHSGALVGRAGLQLIAETGETEVDFIIDPRHWGMGLATEAAKASLQYGFQALGLREIIGLAHRDNHASRRVLVKIGMVGEGTARYFGIEVERYSIEATSWNRNRAATLD